MEPYHPIGSIVYWVGGTPLPEGWVEADGRVIRRKDYPEAHQLFRTKLWRKHRWSRVRIPDLRERKTRLPGGLPILHIIKLREK